ncbi:universal stress protein [Tenacibaculum larymnensis]|uniref:Universal stress protein n=1 Tax=Tenacibaculum larymnensis TaxID=2878201 RepID=A0A9X4IR78_9FLAO|nr:universal stress protein [Tenacibaculum larymnensis]MDE1207926.1 universal stress protein [Tenacibaculum larymnensis]
MKKILIPTDFSENAWNAIVYSLQLFKDETCTFHLLNTYTPIIFQYDYTTVSSSQYKLVDTMKKVSETKLKEVLKRIQNQFNNPKHHFLSSSAFNTLPLEVNELSSDNTIDMIVMGTKGASGVKEVLFGSNTIHVLKNAKCPVLAIPSEFSFETPHEILFPSDYEINFQEKHIQPIVNIASIYHSRVNILNVRYESNLSEEQERNRKMLEPFFEHIALLFHDIKNQSVTGAIENFQLKTRVNLLVMINNKHSFFENLFFKSKINQIGFHLNIPLLVIPS